MSSSLRRMANRTCRCAVLAWGVVLAAMGQKGLAGESPSVRAASAPAMVAVPVVSAPAMETVPAAIAPVMPAVVGPVEAVSANHGSLLPLGSELGEEVLDRPREAFRSEARGGHRPYLVMLGELAFSAPAILGDRARQAGISCNTCHVNGTTNARLFIPGMSSRPGTFDTTGRLFNDKADDGVLDPLTTPSLRGAHLLAPYGHDGRTLSLRDFVRNVITQEFAGPEPSPRVLDAIVLYIDDIDFLPNPRLNANGSLAAPMSDAQRRGELLFHKPFPHDPDLSCSGCHVPHGMFVDHQQHDVGSGGQFKTPTLLNANFNAPYFHDGRYANYAQVVAHFDRVFYLGLTMQDRRDLVAYLEAVGDGEEGTTADDVDTRLREIGGFAAVLETALTEHDGAVATLAADTIDRELRDLTESFPDLRSPAVSGGAEARVRARRLLKGLVLLFRQMSRASESGRFGEAMLTLTAYRKALDEAVPALKAAEPWSLFDRDVHDAQRALVRQLNRAAVDPALARTQHLDVD